MEEIFLEIRSCIQILGNIKTDTNDLHILYR